MYASRRVCLHPIARIGEAVDPSRAWQVRAVEEAFDPSPPQATADEITGPPDFVGIGVQKAGTTWWFDAICAHPDVYSRRDIHKERHFFGRYAIEPFGSADSSLYHDWFPRPAGTLTGEWTPDYMHCPGSPRWSLTRHRGLVYSYCCATRSSDSVQDLPTNTATAGACPRRSIRTL